MRKAILVLAAIFTVFLTGPIEAKLSSGDWSSALREVGKAYKSRDYNALGEALKKVGRDDSRRAVKVLAKVLKRTAQHDPCYRGGVVAFGNIRSEKGVKEITKLVDRRSSGIKLRLLLIDVMENWDVNKSIEVLNELIGDRDERVASAAIRILSKKRDKRAVHPLIKEMSKNDKKKGVVWEDCKMALKSILGIDLQMGVDYKNYVETHGLGRRKETGRSPEKRGPVGSVALFGLQINCQHVVFIIDVSGSMQTTDPMPSDGYGGGGTTRRLQPGEKPKVDKERMRIRRAKKELSKVIQSLKSYQTFNVIAYSHEVHIWSPRGSQKASSSNKSKAVEFVKNFKARGTTATDLALMKAYQVSKKAQCFYLVSDGAPTRDGTNIIPTEQILELITKYDRFRRVKIHTLGFTGAKKDFMKAVANLTHGTYRDIR